MNENKVPSLKETIAKMIVRNSYWGYLFSSVRRIECNDIPTMGVCPTKNGTFELLYNREFVNNLKQSDLELILEHEGLHLLNRHIPRLLKLLLNETDEMNKSKKSRIFNIAADCSVNQLIKDFPSKITFKDKKEITAVSVKLYDLPLGKSTEYYYEKLTKQAKKEQEQAKKEQEQCEGEGQGEGEGEGEGQKGLIGDHSKWLKEIGKNNSEGLIRKLEKELKKIVHSSSKLYKRRRGLFSGDLEELINELLGNTKIPYYQLIKKLVKSSRYSKYQISYNRLNRKRTYLVNNKYNISPFPGSKQNLTFDITIVIDTSGSMSPKDISEGLKGIKQIIEQDRNVTINVIEIDTDIKKEYKIKKIRDIQFNIAGRGGTRLQPAFDKINKDYNTDVILVFTDGFCERLDRNITGNIKTIFVIAEKGTTEYIKTAASHIVRIED